MSAVLYFPISKCLHFLISMPVNLQLVGVEMETNGKKCLQLSILLSMYIYFLMFFVVDHLHYFQTNSSVHETDTRYKNHLYIPSVRLAARERGTVHLAGKIFNKLPPRISGLKNGKTISSLLWGNIFLHVFYSIEEFLSHEQL